MDNLHQHANLNAIFTEINISILMMKKMSVFNKKEFFFFAPRNYFLNFIYLFKCVGNFI